MSYDLRLTATAERHLASLGSAIRAQLLLRVYQLANDPRPHSAVLLDPEDESYYMDIGGYRVVYWVQRSKVFVLMIVSEEDNRGK